jgi:hypothetical protein
LTANDGIYSAEFGRNLVDKAGIYIVIIHVDNSGNKGKIPKYTTASRAPTIEHLGPGREHYSIPET